LHHDHVLSRYGLENGVQRYGEAAVVAVQKELQQLNDRDVMEVQDQGKKSKVDKIAALNYRMIVKEKVIKQ
jgi:hypothetical protein